MLKTLKAYGFLLLVGGAVLAADQALKAWVQTHIPLGEVWTPIPSLPWFRITYWHNSGMAFGLGQAWGTALLILGAVYGIALFLAFPAIARNGWWLRWGLAIQWGGALGNLLDRIRHGSVVDFIAVGRFPVFNLADAAISISLLFLLLGEFLVNEPQEPASAENLSESPSETVPHDL